MSPSQYTETKAMSDDTKDILTKLFSTDFTQKKLPACQSSNCKFNLICVFGIIFLGLVTKQEQKLNRILFKSNKIDNRTRNSSNKAKLVPLTSLPNPRVLKNSKRPFNLKTYIDTLSPSRLYSKPISSLQTSSKS